MAEDQECTLPPLEERPLVTFALFAYNQEKYIREAVEGAFAQTYEPLEIILSDDCSTDRTFEIMQSMASVYEGPHRVTVRRNDLNQGVLFHLLTVSRNASGEIIVVAAGDDISLPTRTAIVVSTVSSDDLAVSSGMLKIDPNGKLIGHTDYDSAEKKWHLLNPYWVVHGASAAYRTNFLKSLPLPQIRVDSEDTAISIALKLFESPCKFVNKHLVKYRKLHGSLSQSVALSGESIWEEEARWLSGHRRLLSVNQYVISLISSHSDQARLAHTQEILSLIVSQNKFLALYVQWQKLSLINRLRLFYFACTTGNLSQLRTRLFGRKIFHLIKTTKRKLEKLDLLQTPMI